MNLLERELQCAYGGNSSTRGIIRLAETRIKTGKANELISLDRTEAFRKIDRGEARLILYKKVLPID